MKLKHPLNLHKGLTFIFILGLMLVYDNFTIGAWIYLALHGTYGILWLFKDSLYPDKQWEQEVSFVKAILIFAVVSLYWVAPFILISRGTVPPPPLIAAAIAINIIGLFVSLNYSNLSWFCYADATLASFFDSWRLRGGHLYSQYAQER
jgi:hypothetical protein